MLACLYGAGGEEGRIKSDATGWRQGLRDMRRVGGRNGRERRTWRESREGGGLEMAGRAGRESALGGTWRGVTPRKSCGDALPVVARGTGATLRAKIILFYGFFGSGNGLAPLHSGISVSAAR